VLRFFEKKNFNDVGVTRCTNEEAAKKRVFRAVDKLRSFFLKRGTILPAATLIGLLSANSISAAPAGLASTVAAGAVLQEAVASFSTLTLIKGTLKIMAWTKFKTAVVISAAVILGGGTTAVVVKKIVLPAIQPTPSDDDSLWTINSANLDKQPRILLIRPTHFPNGGGWVMKDQRALGQNAHVETMIPIAYNSRSTRMIFPPSLQATVTKDRFDFLVNLPTGNSAAFQAELKKQFGIVGRREMREVDALLLKIKSPDAVGLKISNEQYGSSTSGNGNFSMKRTQISALASQLEYVLEMPVINQTRLTANYDIELKWNNANTPDESASLKQVVEDQLGLELIPSRELIEMLIVEKSKD
jgi:uncharacterized protein (TIGR03435 family)